MSAGGRRRFLGTTTGAACLQLFAPLVRATELLPKSGMRVVVVGGGFGGAIAAKTLRLARPELEVVLVERNRSYSALPGANWVIGGSRQIEENRLSYEVLEKKHGVRMLHGEAQLVDVAAKTVVLDGGVLPYDHVIVAPGIGFRTGEIEGYVAGETPSVFPHAWMEGTEVISLVKRLEAMRDGGLVVVSLPLPPYRCPQAAYERVSQIAFYLRRTKPRSKIIVLDASPTIASLAELFLSGWARNYGTLIEYRGGQQLRRIDASKFRLATTSEIFGADVVNLIPPQMAGALAHRSGLVDAGEHWCTVDHATYESARAPGVYVIGDACRTEGMQKSASSANAQGKACALNIAASLEKRKPQPHLYSNIEYSLLDDRQGASTVAFYRGDGRKATRMTKGGGNSTEWTDLEGIYARAWLGGILAEMSS